MFVRVGELLSSALNDHVSPGDKHIQKTSRSGPDTLISIARPAFAAAPREKKNRRRPEACHIERSSGICYIQNFNDKAVYVKEIFSQDWTKKRSRSICQW